MLDEPVKTAGNDRAAGDLEAWHTWNNNGRKADDLEPLMNRMKPVVRKATNVYAGRVQSIPKEAVEAEFEIQAIKAFHSYDPSKGTAPATHLTAQLKRGRRFITDHQNAARVPENRAYMIGNYQRSKDQLQDELGRAPSTEELSDHMKVPKIQITKLENELRAEIPMSHLQGSLVSTSRSPERDLIHFLPQELTPEEQLVFELLSGSYGKPQMTA